MLLMIAAAYATDLLVPGTYATIGDALDVALAGDTVVLDPGTYSEDVNVLVDVNFRGSGLASTVLDGGVDDSLFWVGAGVTVVVEDLAMTTSFARRCVNSAGGNVTLRRVHLHDCGEASIHGGAVFGNLGSNVTIEDSTLEADTALRGAHVYFVGVDLEIERTLLQTGTTGIDGGVYFNGTNLSIVGSTFLDNTAGTDGAAIMLFTGTAGVTDTVFDGNTAPAGRGGAIGAFGAQALDIEGSTFVANTAGRAAALDAVFVTDLQVRRSVFCDNTGGLVGGIGGAVRAESSGTGAHRWSNNVFQGNAVVADGGAVTAFNSHLHLDHHTFVTHGGTGLGGTLHVATSSEVDLSNSLVLDTTSGYGVGVDALVPWFGSDHDAWWQNVPGDYSGPVAFWPGANDLFVDPELQAWAGDCATDQLWPSAGSPLVDAGAGTDADGSLADIGAWGGLDPLCVLGTYWLDADADGHGDVAVPTRDCALPAGYAADALDCDDADPALWDATASWYTDGDGDGHGGPYLAAVGCAPPPQSSASTDDCDDANAAVYPGATEVCDGLDDDCDGFTTADEADGDGDGFAPCAGDCAPSDATVHPGAPETCDGADQDCDGASDDGLFAEWVEDADGDGFGAGKPVVACAPPGPDWTTTAGDCDDADAATHPGAPDPCEDGVDQDCDGADPACDATTGRPCAFPVARAVDPGCGCATPGGGGPLLALAGLIVFTPSPSRRRVHTSRSRHCTRRPRARPPARR